MLKTPVIAVQSPSERMQMNLGETEGGHGEGVMEGGGQLKNAQSNNIEDKAFLLSN